MRPHPNGPRGRISCILLAETQLLCFKGQITSHDIAILPVCEQSWHGQAVMCKPNGQRLRALMHWRRAPDCPSLRIRLQQSEKELLFNSMCY